MKYNKSITILVICICVLSVVACLCGFFFTGGQGEGEFLSIRGEMIKMNGTGLYQYESMNQKLALKVQDMITLTLGLPLLILSLYLSLRGSIKGRLLLTGTVGYFLYSYLSYAFLRMYNPLFLVYVVLMAASLFAFVLCFMSFEVEKFATLVSHKMPVKFIGAYLVLLAFGLIFTWLLPIVDFLANGTLPISLEHYTTLGYEAIDLGFIVPALFVSAVLIMKRKPFGYLLSSVIIMLSASMNILISVLTIAQMMSGVDMPIILMGMFPAFTIITAFCLILMLKNIKEVKDNIEKFE